MQLSPEQFQKMNAYIGCGPHLDADILIMGNEEGTNGYPNQIAANAVARFRLYGKGEAEVSALLDQMDYDREGLSDDRNFSNEQYKYSLNGNWREGFWEESARSGGEKISRYMERYNGTLPDRTIATPSLFNTYSARLCLSLQGIKKNRHFPIETYLSNSISTSIREEINSYAEEGLYTKNPKCGVSTALMDWRPLPRPNEGGWPEEYHSIFKTQKEYMDAFDFKRFKTKEIEAFVMARLNFLKAAIMNSQAQYLITIGRVDNKKEILTRMFPDQQLDFNRIPISNRSYETTIDMPNRKLKVYVLAFFKNFSINNYSHFAQYHFIPDFIGYERPAFDEETRPVHLPHNSVIRARVKKNNREQRSGNEELLFLEDLALRMKTLIPTINHTKAYRVNKVNYNFMFMWNAGEHWSKEGCRLEIHANFYSNEAEIEINWALRPDCFEEVLRTKVIVAAEEIGTELAKYEFKKMASKVYIEYRKTLKWSNRDDSMLDESVAQIQQVLNTATDILSIVS